MDNSIITYLEQLDLSEIEAKLYLKLLETGPISVKDLAQQIGIKRTTAYLYIDQLIENGLIAKVINGARQQVAANNPVSSLEDLIEIKTDTVKSIQKQFPDIIRSINLSFSEYKEIGEAEIRYYKGKNGVKKIYEEALKAKEVRSYFNSELIKDALPENEVLFISAITNNKTKIFEILQDSPVSKKQLFEFQEKNPIKNSYIYKFLPKNVTLSAADILIYDGNVAIVTVSNKISGVILKNAAYYNNSKEIFNLVWNILPDPNIR